MAAYFMVDVDIKDMERIEEYRDGVPRTVQKYGETVPGPRRPMGGTGGQLAANTSGCSGISKRRTGEAVV